MSGGTVLVTDPIGRDDSIIRELLVSSGLLTLTPGPDTPWQDLAEQADGLIVNLADIDAAVISRLKR